MSAKSKYLKVALQAAKKAEAILLKYQRGKLEAKRKQDQTPVTIADTEAEKAIKATIQKSFPSHDILGEEFGGKMTPSKYHWVIDPIDGTKNYLRGLPMFATQIALVKNGKIILGVSNAPALGELIYAEKGCGVYCNGTRIRVSRVRKLDNAYLSFGGIKHFGRLRLTSALLKLANKVQGYRSFGDFWQYHLFAQGKIDIVAEADLQ
ncbi:unnamed protein product, partial [marine sediment metagenome]